MCILTLCSRLDKPMSSGKYIWAQPTPATALLPVTGNVAHNVGVFVHAILSHPGKTQGKYMNVKTEVLTFQQILNVWGEVSGKDAVYVEIGFEEFQKLWGPFGVEMAKQYRFGEVAKGDWEVLAREKGLLVQPDEVGIAKSDLIDLRQTFNGMKDSLV